MGSRNVAGALLFIGGAEFILGLTLAESLYPGYNVSSNVISDLGAGGGNHALIFNASVIALGVLIVASAFLLWKAYNDRVFSILLILAGLGAIGVGCFPLDTGTPHQISAFFTFFFGAVWSLVSFRKIDRPFAPMIMALGTISLVSLFLFITGNYLGLGAGGIERFVMYPVLATVIGVGGYLMASVPESDLS